MQSYIDQLDRKVFTFIDYEGYDDRYPALSTQAFPRAFYEEIRQVSRGLFGIFCKATQVFQAGPDGFAGQMDMPQELIPYLHKANILGLPTWLSRFDYVLDRDGHLKMVELNADTPCFLIESYYANGVAAGFVGKSDPNEGLRDDLRAYLGGIHDVVMTMASKGRIESAGSIFEQPFVFACFDDYIEDAATTRFLMEEMKAARPHMDARFLSLYDMAIDPGGIPLDDGAYAAGLYRLHPMELLIDETTPDGEPLGHYFLDLYQEGKFALFNPPEAIIMQNKSFMALVYALYLTDRFFTPQERKLIEDYLVPSYFENDFSALADGSYIQKEIWGREGRHVKVMEKRNGEAQLHLEKEVDNYDDIVCRDSNRLMYQDFIQQKVFRHRVDSGTKDGYLTLSCCMLGGKPSAVGCRFSPEKIAGTEAYFVPLIVE
jgi:hypothetical protein